MSAVAPSRLPMRCPGCRMPHPSTASIQQARDKCVQTGVFRPLRGRTASSAEPDVNVQFSCVFRISEHAVHEHTCGRYYRTTWPTGQEYLDDFGVGGRGRTG